MVGDMTEQGLGQLGGQPQPPQAEFTVDTANRKNAEIVERVRTNSGTGLGTVRQVNDGMVPPTVQQGLGQVVPTMRSMSLDQDAIEAVRSGQVNPMDVMNDPNISGGAKATIQGMMS